MKRCVRNNTSRKKRVANFKYLETNDTTLLVESVMITKKWLICAKMTTCCQNKLHQRQWKQWTWSMHYYESSSGNKWESETFPGFSGPLMKFGEREACWENSRRLSLVLMEAWTIDI